MTTDKVTWVLCDGASDPHAPDDALVMSLGDKSDSISIDFEGVDKTLGGEMSPRFFDLIRIATMVLGADGAVRRGALEDEDDRHWRRSFEFVIGVEDLEFWRHSGVDADLAGTLGFLSQDSFAFHFVKRQKTPVVKQLRFSAGDGTTFVPWDNVSSVSMFSGGLDSFTGAADTIFNEGGAPLLVSHRAATKVTHRQERLFHGLQELANQSGARQPHRLSVDVTKHDRKLRAEHTHRTRSLLYAAIGGAAARLIGLEEVRMYENGVVAINLPIAASVVGTRATRTAHPRVLSGFAKILSKVAEKQVSVVNPYVLRTRGEVLRVLSETPAADHARDTISCAHVHGSSTMHPHCGTCSQCIDRRLSFVATGLAHLDPEEGYEHRLATDEWADGPRRNLLMSWLAKAQGYASTPNRETFFDENGDAARACMAITELWGTSSEDAAEHIFAMHRRHGEAVVKAVNVFRAAAASQRCTRRLGEFTLPVLLAKKELEAAGLQTTPVAEPGLRNELRNEGTSWRMRFRNGEPFSLPDSTGMRYLAILLGDPATTYAPEDLIDVAAGRDRKGAIGVNASGKAVIQHRITAIEQERDEAQEVCDEPEAQRCQAEIDQLSQILSRPPAKRSQQARSAAEQAKKNLRDAVALVGKQSRQLRAHLGEHLIVSDVSWYRRSGLHWCVVDTSLVLADDEWVLVSELVNRNDENLKNGKKVTQFCKKMGVPTRRPKKKNGEPNPQRLEAHKPTFDARVKTRDKEANRLSDMTDEHLTGRMRANGELGDANSAE